MAFLAEPKLPELLGLINFQQKERIIATEDIEINVACRSSHGRPPAQIRWVISTDPEGHKIINSITNNLTSHPHRSIFFF